MLYFRVYARRAPRIHQYTNTARPTLQHSHASSSKMSNNAMQLAKHKTELLSAALELYKGNRLDPGYVKAEADAEKMFKKEMAKLRKRERQESGKPLSEKLQQVEDLNLPGETYEKVAQFDTYPEAQDALWARGGWITSKSGRRGSTKARSYHGGDHGKYKITCDKDGDGTAYLWAATTNDNSFSVDDLDGAKELDDEGEEDQEEDQDDELLDELDTVIVAAGKTVDQIKMMPALEKTKHANLCNKNRSISAESVKEIATKFGCPSEYTTKVSKLGWIFLNKLQA